MRFSRLMDRRALTAAAALFGCVAALPGCYWEGGAGFSLDQHTYVSTSWQPKTITVRDTRTGQDIWSVDIPVGKQLVVKFSRDASEDNFNPDVMRWGILDDDTLWEPSLPNAINVPGRNDRRVDMELRPAPELPGDQATAEPVNEPTVPISPEGGGGDAGAGDPPASNPN